MMSLVRLLRPVAGPIARFFLSPKFPARVRVRIQRALERNRLTRSLVLRLPSRMQMDGGTFVVDVGKPNFTTRLAFLTGVYESSERGLIRSHMLAGVPVLEIGAGLGVISSLAWRAAGSPSMVVVEANPAVYEVLRANLEQNNVPATLVHSALGYDGDYVSFVAGDSWIEGSVKGRETEASSVQVPATSLSALLDEHFGSTAQVQLILDVEGAEWDMLEREPDVIRKRVARVIVELHGKEEAQALLDKGRRAFGALGFKELGADGNVACYGSAL